MVSLVSMRTEALGLQVAADVWLRGQFQARKTNRHVDSARAGQ